jgi:hypothetical protein
MYYLLVTSGAGVRLFKFFSQEQRRQYYKDAFKRLKEESGLPNDDFIFLDGVNKGDGTEDGIVISPEDQHDGIDDICFPAR